MSLICSPTNVQQPVPVFQILIGRGPGCSRYRCDLPPRRPLTSVSVKRRAITRTSNPSTVREFGPNRRLQTQEKALGKSWALGLALDGSHRGDEWQSTASLGDCVGRQNCCPGEVGPERSGSPKSLSRELRKTGATMDEIKGTHGSHFIPARSRNGSAACQLWRDSSGWELRLVVGRLVCTEICRDSETILEVQECWAMRLQERGWTDVRDD
jgi:hypothetical protein